MFLPFHTLENAIRPTTHFLSEGVGFSVFFNSFFYHCSLFYQPMLLGGGGCCMSIFSFIVLGGGCRIILHCSVIIVLPRKQLLYPHLLFWEGIDSSIKCVCIYIFFSIILHACPVPYFKKILFDHSIPYEEIESFMSCRKTPLPSIIALSFHTLTGPAWSISL